MIDETMIEMTEAAEEETAMTEETTVEKPVKVTRKMLFERIKEMMSDDAEVVEMCDKYIAALSKPREKKVNTEQEEWYAAVATWLSEQESPVTQNEAGLALEVSPNKAGAALRELVKRGVAVMNEPEKRGGCKTYQMM